MDLFIINKGKPMFLRTFCVILLAACVGCEPSNSSPDGEDSEPIEEAVAEGIDEEESEPEAAVGDDLRPPELVIHGAQRRINLKNDTSPRVSLADLFGGPQVPTHGVGALGDLSGELTLWDDEVYLAHAGDEPRFEKRQRAGDVDRQATLFFGSVAADWTEPASIEATDLAALERELERWRKDAGVDEALSFRITDPAATVAWHVIDADRLPEEGVSSCEERKELAHQFDTEGEPVRIAGIYTTDHTSVVVDHTTSIHAHVITDDDETGHIDELELSEQASIEVARR